MTTADYTVDAVTTADYLTQLIDSKQDIKAAIEEKGVEVTGGLTSYADAIENIALSPIKMINGLKLGGCTTGDFTDFDFSDVVDGRFMWENGDFTKIILNDTVKNINDFFSAFRNCGYLLSVPVIDCSKVYDVDMMFFTTTNITSLGGFKDLGKQESLSGTDNMIDYCRSLTYESAMNVINNLYDRASAGYSILTLKFHANVLRLLSDDDIAIATNKGWILS